MLLGNIAVFHVLFLLVLVFQVLVFWVLGLRSFRYLGSSFSRSLFSRSSFTRSSVFCLCSSFSRHPDDRCQTQVVSFSY